MFTDSDIMALATELRRMGSLHFETKAARDEVAARLKATGRRVHKRVMVSRMTRNYVVDSGDRTDYGLGNDWTIAKYHLDEV